MRSPLLSLPILLGIAVVVALALIHSAEIRARAEAGLGRAMPAREAELARGFVLGADEGIDARTKEDFRRSGLSHLLAVSGENVTLLALLAMPLLGALGIGLRERLVWLVGLIVVIVLAAAGALLGAQYNVLQSLNLPRIPVDEGTATTAGIITLVAILLVTLLGAVLGGKLGDRYHRRVDRVGYDAV